MDSSTDLVPPAELDALQADLAELAVGGMVAPRPGSRDWLETTGIARTTAGGRLVADDDWLLCSLPAPSEAELLVRSLLRDPLYRLHVDLLLAKVVTEVGTSGRWPLLEGLIFGELFILAPRLAALVELVKPKDGVWENACWDGLEPLPPSAAVELDERCWGISGGAETMFPVLRARYPTFASVPVLLRAADPLVALIVAAASTGEAVRVPVERQKDLAILVRRGLPLWYQALGDGILEVTLSAPCRTRGELEDLASHPYSRGVPAHVRAGSALLPSRPEVVRPSFWEMDETRISGLAFVGTSSRDGWPSDEDAARRGIPRGDDLSSLVRARRLARSAQDPADEALRSLSDHPLFGFWLQILLVEALDRELGEETLLFAPPTHAIVDDVEAATRVYYRPRSEAERQPAPLRELGALDDALMRVALAVGVLPVAVLGDAVGPWSMSLALLARIGIVQTRHDRWTLSTHTLDRLHGGGLMTGVIRRGRGFRERIHDVLKELWSERVGTTQETYSA